jgi:hypothetical protein
MTEFTPRQFTFRPIENVPENAEELLAYGYESERLSPGEVVIVNVQRDAATGELVASMDEFNALYEPEA